MTADALQKTWPRIDITPLQDTGESRIKPPHQYTVCLRGRHSTGLLRCGKREGAALSSFHFRRRWSSNWYFSPCLPATGSRETTGVQLMARGSRKYAQVYPTVQRANLDAVVNNTAASEQEYRATVSGRSANPANELSMLEASPCDTATTCEIS